MIKKAVLLFALCLLFPALTYAATAVTEGDEAKKLYETEKGKAQILVQKDKNFILRTEGAETPKPATLKVKAGERFYILNEEAEYVHNVYDESDAGWVLKKQEPSTVAAVSFGSPGEHKLRCAIHPQMRITVAVQ
jgi:plastocyanin